MILSETIRRFPVPLTCVALGIAAYTASEFGLFELSSRGMLISPIIIGFFASLPIHVFAEARGWQPRKGALFAALAAGYGAAHILVVPIAAPGSTGLTLWFFVLALALMTLTAPFMADAADFGEAAQYVRGALIYLALGLIATTLIAAALPLAAHTLLGMNIGVILPLDLAPAGLAVSLILFPKPPGEASGRGNEGEQHPGFLAGLLTLVALLALPMLYWLAYLTLTEPDRDGLSGLGLPVLSVVAVVCHTALYTPLEEATVARRAWQRYYRAAAALPGAVALPTLLTEATTILDVLGLLALAWVIAAGLLAALSVQRAVALPTTIVAAMLALAGYAPASTEHLLDQRRIAALERILARNDILTDGRISLAHRKLPHADGKQLYDLIESMTRPTAGNGLAEFLAEHGVEFEDGALHTGCPSMRSNDAAPAKPCNAKGRAEVIKDVLASLGLRKQRYFEQSRFDLLAGFDYRTEKPPRIDVDGFDRLHRRAAITLRQGQANILMMPDAPLDLTISGDGLSLIVTTSDGRLAGLDFAPLIEYLQRNAGRVDDGEFRRLAVLDGGADGLKLRAYPYEIGIEPRGNHWALRKAEFVLLVGQRR